MTPTAKELTARVLHQAASRIERMGTTRAQLAEQCSIPPSTFFGWFGRSTIGLRTLEKLAAIVDMEPGVMLLAQADVDMLRRLVTGNCTAEDVHDFHHLMRGTL